MTTRKDFLKKSALLAAGAALPFFGPNRLFAGTALPDITILYTNDTHARLDPFPVNAVEFAGFGGIARRASLVNKIRSQVKNVLLLDAGDVFQGTPWFDVYGGKVDLELMTKMNYDAMAIGNHEFDRGPDGFADAAQKAGFPILASNYQVKDTPMNPYVQRLLVKEFNGFRVGIFGLGIQLAGLVPRELFGDVQYRNPEAWARGMTNSLRQYHQCDYVICLSHLGYSYSDGRIDDLKLADKVDGIDLIIGGHTHTFLDNPVSATNPSGASTLVTQMGHGGVRLGRIDLNLSEHNSPFVVNSRFYTIGEKT